MDTAFQNFQRSMGNMVSVLSEHSFDIQYRSGSKHSNADGLSNIPVQITEIYHIMVVASA